jgi:hypothetical protein
MRGSPTRRFAISVVLIVALVVVVFGGGGTSSATEPPPVPTTLPGVNASESITVFSGSTLSLSIPAQPTLNVHGVDVGLGGAYQCGETGCQFYGISWQVIGDAHVDFVDGCDGTTWSCQLTFTPNGAGTQDWTEIRANFGHTGANLYTKSFFLWAPPTMQFVEFQSVGFAVEGEPDTTAIYKNDIAYAVRGGTSPTLGECEPKWWWQAHAYELPPTTPDCVQLNPPLNGYGNWGTYLPVGSGPWVIYSFVVADEPPSTLVANAGRWTTCGPRGCGTWPPFNIVMIDDEAMLVDVNWVPNSVGSSSTTTTTTSPSSTSSSTIVGTAPKPPVITGAVPGEASGPDQGSVVGTVDGQPGATATVTIAGNVGETCARQMTGTGVYPVGSTSVTFDSEGHATFTIPGPVQASSFLYGTAGASAVGDCYTAPPFADVGWSHPFVDDIVWLVDQGITTGFVDGTYRPGAAITRATMAAFLYRYEGSPAFDPPEVPTFPDVPTTHPFFTEIEWAVAEGLTGGFPDGTFRPGTTITRASMAAFFYRLAQEPAHTPPASPSFPDVPASHTFFGDIEWLADNAITGGYSDGTYRPGSSVTRGSMAAFLHRFDDLAT